MRLHTKEQIWSFNGFAIWWSIVPDSLSVICLLNGQAVKLTVYTVAVVPCPPVSPSSLQHASHTVERSPQHSFHKTISGILHWKVVSTCTCFKYYVKCTSKILATKYEELQSRFCFKKMQMCIPLIQYVHIKGFLSHIVKN